MTLRFLVDNSLSPQVSDALQANGFDAAHVRDYGMRAASDEAIMARALQENRIVVAADTDFGTLLALGGAERPSVILFRGEENRRPSAQIKVLLANLEAVSEALESGCIVVFQWRVIRIRQLPMA